MKKIFFISLIFFLTFPLSSLAGTCQWTNTYDNDKVETVTPKVKPGPSQDGDVVRETCDEAVARREQEVQREHAYRNARNTITGGSQRNCPWKSPLPPHTEESLTVNKIGENEDGTPQYESCRDAQRRRQKQWIDTEFNGHREDAEAAIDAENQRLDREAMSANEKARKASKKQQKTSLIATAGSMAAGVRAAACYSQCSSSGTGCCSSAPYWAALSAGLGMAGLALGLASGDNAHIAAEYQGGLLPPALGGGGAATAGGGTATGGTTGEGTATGGNEPGGLSTSGGDVIPTTGGGIPNPNITLTEPPEITFDNEKVVPLPKNLGPFLKERGLKWDPKKKSITLPDGRSYSAEDTNSPGFKKFASSGPAQAFQGQIKGLEGQIANAMGDDEGSDDLGSGLEEEEGDASLGGGGFAGYGGGAGGTMIAANGRRPGSAGGDGSGSDKGSKVAGMSVKMGKNKVGVSQDNIFEMIHRRYQAKRKKRQFIELNL